MLSRYQHKRLTWIDLESPDAEEVKSLMAEFGLHAPVAEELLSATMKPKVDRYGEYLYLVLHFPALRHSHSKGVDQEVDFVIGKDFVITARYDTIDALHKFSKLFEVNSILDKETLGEHGGHLFFAMIKKLYRGLEHELEFINDRLREIEERVFKGREKEMVREISGVSRDLLAIEQSLASHERVLQSFEGCAKRLFGEAYGFHAREILLEYRHIKDQVASLMGMVRELRETNNSLLSTKQNEIMKVLTIMAFVTFPLTLISSVFGMNTSYLPIVGMKNDFWIVLGGMGTLAILFFLFFKRKGWL